MDPRQKQEKEIIEYLESIGLMPSFRPQRLNVVEIIRAIMTRYDLFDCEDLPRE